MILELWAGQLIILFQTTFPQIPLAGCHFPLSLPTTKMQGRTNKGHNIFRNVDAGCPSPPAIKSIAYEMYDLDNEGNRIIPFAMCSYALHLSVSSCVQVDGQAHKNTPLKKGHDIWRLVASSMLFMLIHV